jgi:hypothetical protein
MTASRKRFEVTKMPSAKTIYVVGTSHSIQIEAKASSRGITESFRALIAKMTKRYAVRLIGEEMSREGLQRANETICEGVARNFNIGHEYCDPDSAERIALGISEVNQNLIAGELWHKLPSGTPRDVIERAAAADPRVRRSYEAREREWIRRLNARDLFPVLFVCGAFHVAPFSELAKADGLSVVVLEEDWDGT